MSFRTQISIINIANPSSSTYEELQRLYFDTLRCPCTRTNILYQAFVSSSPVFHQVCSSDFVTDRWLEILSKSYTIEDISDWRNRAFPQFQLLTNLCRFATQTVNDNIHRFLTRSLITSNAITQSDFENQMNATLEEFIRSTTVYFDLFVETARLLIQVDQPFMGGKYAYKYLIDPNLFLSVLTEEVNGETNKKVYCMQDEK